METPNLEGLIAAPPTPLSSDGALDAAAIEPLAGALADAGVRGAFVCGTTGEGPSLSTHERRTVAERWVAATPEDFAVIVHAGHTSLQECRALAEHAERIGADAVGAMAPFFFKPQAAPDLVNFCERAASAAPSTPFYYYHIPAMTGVDLPMIDFLREAADRIPTLAGMKFTCEDLMDYGRCLRYEEGRFDMLFGRDEILLSALALGARGAVGATYNFAAPLYLRLMEAFGRGELAAARADQHRAAEMIAVLGRFGGVRAAKATMKLIGLDCGPPRPPLRPLGGQELDALGEALQEVGFFRYAVEA